MSANVGRSGAVRRLVQAWTSNAAWLPSQHRVGGPVGDEVGVGPARLDPRLAPAPEPGRVGRAKVLLPEARERSRRPGSAGG